MCNYLNDTTVIALQQYPCFHENWESKAKLVFIDVHTLFMVTKLIILSTMQNLPNTLCIHQVGKSLTLINTSKICQEHTSQSPLQPPKFPV